MGREGASRTLRVGLARRPVDPSDRFLYHKTTHRLVYESARAERPDVDDVILEPGEIDFFPEVFGDRATIFPYGGHCGNMSYRDNVALMVDTFTAGGAK